MATIRGCAFPDDLYYFVEKHVWLKPTEGKKVRLGVTAVVSKLVGNITALTPRKKYIGKVVEAGKSVATAESSKYVGPVPSPITGTLVAVNEALADNPALLVKDPYGAGWVAELEVDDWDAAKSALLSGAEAVKAYTAFLEQENISCD
jgi:glycine cleavage system H protein